MQNKHQIKAYKLFKQEKYDQALKSYNKAIEISPENPDIHSERGVLFFHMGEKLKALDDMNRSLELEPTYAYRYTSRAYIKDSLGDVEGAVEDYLIALKLDPDDAITLNNLGLLEEKLGRMQAAQRRFEKADKLIQAENRLFDTMNDLEKNGIEENEIDSSSEDVPVSDEPEEQADSFSTRQKFNVIKGVFSNKSQFKEFIRFVKKGFKYDDGSTKK